MQRGSCRFHIYSLLENTRDFLFCDVARPPVVTSALLTDQLWVWVVAQIGIGIEGGTAAPCFANLQVMQPMCIEFLMLAIEDGREVLCRALVYHAA